MSEMPSARVGGMLRILSKRSNAGEYRTVSNKPADLLTV